MANDLADGHDVDGLEVGVSSRVSQHGGGVAALDRVSPLRTMGRYALLLVVTFIVVFPLYTMLIASLKPGDRVLHNPLVPDSFTLDVLRDAWTSGHLGRYLLNSTVVAIAVTLAQVVTSVVSAYAFAILDWPGRQLGFVVFLSTLLIPVEATLLVNLDTIDSLGWINSYQGLAVPFFATAFGTFLLRQVFLGLPRDLRDAGTIDGVGHFGFLWFIALPLVRPTLAALALFSFLNTWNMYLWPRLVVDNSDWNTVQSGLKFLSDSSSADQPNLVMAGTLIAAVPIFVVLLIFQRQLVRGLTAGAVKG